MSTFKLGLAVIVLATALSTGAYAASRDAGSSENQMSAARWAAIHECSVEAGKWSMIVWQNKQYAVYGTCMAEHAQQP